MTTTTYLSPKQAAPAINTLTDLYTVPASTQAVVSTLAICNTTVNQAYVRVAVRPAGAAIATKHYIVYDSSFDPKSSQFLTLGLTLGAGDVVSVQTDVSGVTFNLSGTEFS